LSSEKIITTTKKETVKKSNPILRANRQFEIENLTEGKVC
jgi:hypothetical protein